MDDLLPRKTVAVGRELLSAFPAVVIQGARQVGKSTLTRQLVETRSAVAVTLDDRRTRDAAVAATAMASRST